MRSPVTCIAALLILTAATPGFSKEKNKGPEGVWLVRANWEADFEPVGAPDGDPERYWATEIVIYHPEGTFLGVTHDSGLVLSGYWVATGERTVVQRLLSLDHYFDGEDWFTVGSGDGTELTFDAEFQTFTGTVGLNQAWLCPRSPWGGPWNAQCPNPLTTSDEPDVVTTAADGIVLEGWRLPKPTVP